MTQDSRLMKQLGSSLPLIVAPMAGGPSSPALVATASKAGALGSVGAAYQTPSAITEFAQQIRRQTDAPFAINLFVPHPQPMLGAHQIDSAIAATSIYRDELGLPTPVLSAPFEEDFELQFEAALRARPAAISFVFGVLPSHYMRMARAAGILLIGTATSLLEAKVLEESGVDAIVLQGFEAGGHRGVFDANGEDLEIGLFDLIAACRPAIARPLIAAGGIMNATDVRNALSTGVQAVQMGTAFLACIEAGTSAPYRARLLEHSIRRTKTSRVYSGRLARGIENRFMREMEQRMEAVLPFPAQNKFTRDLRAASAAKGCGDLLSLWSGSSPGSLWQGSARELIEDLFA